MLLDASVKALSYTVGILSYCMKVKSAIENLFLHYSLLFAMVQIAIALVTTIAGHYDAPNLDIRIMFCCIYMGVLVYTHGSARRFHCWLAAGSELFKK